MAQTVEGLSYEICSANIATIFRPRIMFILAFGTCPIIHQQLVAMLRGFMRFVYMQVKNRYVR